MLIPNILYSGEVELLFNEGKHAYYVDSQKIPSVTTILSVLNKPALIGWAANQATDFLMEEIKAGVAYDEVQLKTAFDMARKAHARKRDKAGDIGTFVHQWINEYITGKEPATPINEEIKKAIEQFLKWEKEHDVKFLLSEEAIFSKDHQFAGTLDFIAKIDGKLVLGDVKTSAAIWDEYWFQTAAYQLAREEEYPNEKYDYRGIIRIGKEGGFEWKTSQEGTFERDRDAFLACNILYKITNQIKKERDNDE